MKKILIFVGFLFAVVCYAAPPPELLPVNLVPDVGYQVAADAVEIIAPVMIEAQEVAYNYIGDYQFAEVQQYAEKTIGVKVPPMQVITINYSICSLQKDLPPLLRTWQVSNYNYNRDMQFTNYGYPISMN